VSPGSRGFLYDDMRSADRWNREYTASDAAITATPAQYDATIGKFYTRLNIAAAGPQFKWFFNMSQQFKNFDLRLITRSNNAFASRSWFCIMASRLNYSGIGVGIVAVNTTVKWIKAPFIYYNFTGAPYTPPTNTWCNVRFQKDSRAWKQKWWLYGVQEPDWTAVQATGDMTTSGTNLMNQGYTNQPQYIGFGSYSDAVNAIYQDIADIRITPIRKVGGP